MENSYISLVVDSTGNIQYAWLSDDKGIILITDIQLSASENPDNDYNTLTSSFNKAKESLGEDVSQSDLNK